MRDWFWLLLCLGMWEGEALVTEWPVSRANQRAAWGDLTNERRPELASLIVTDWRSVDTQGSAQDRVQWPGLWTMHKSLSHYVAIIGIELIWNNHQLVNNIVPYTLFHELHIPMFPHLLNTDQIVGCNKSQTVPCSDLVPPLLAHCCVIPRWRRCYVALVLTVLKES